MHSAPPNAGTTKPALVSGFTRRLILGLVAVNLAALLLGGVSVWTSRQHIEKSSAVTSRNLAQVLERNIKGVLDQVNLTLLSVADEVKRQEELGRFDDETLNRFIARQHARVPTLDSLRFSDEHGRVSYGVGVSPNERISIADRDYFMKLRDDAAAGLVISEPMTGRISGKVVVIAARRLTHVDGSFAGVVYGPITLQYFYDLFASLDVGRNGVITLRDAQYGIVARYPFFEGAGGATGNRTTSAEFKRQVAANPKEATYIAKAGSDLVERVLTYRKVESYPLYIIAGLATQDYLAEWRKDVLSASAFGGLFLLITACGAWLLHRSWTDKAASEQRFSLLLNSAGEGIYGVTPNGLCMFCNPAALRMLGYATQQELLGKNMHEIIHHSFPDGRPYPLEECRIFTAYRTGRDFHTDEEVFWRADGSSFPVEYWSSAQRIGQELHGAVVTFADISERKRAEAARRKSEERFRAFVERSAVPIVMLRHMNVHYANARAAAMCGCAGPEEMLGRDMKSFVATAARDAFKRFEARLTQDQMAPKSFETVGLRNDATEFDMHVTADIVELDDGPVTLAFCQDISERKRTEVHIRQLGEALKQTLEAIVLLDANLRFTYVNPAFTALFGYRQTEVEGQSIMLLASADAPSNPGPVQTTAMARELGVFRGEALRVAKDGRVIPLLLNVAPVFGPQGELTGYVSVMTDLTALKQAEEELRQRAHYDALTGLPNRALFFDRLSLTLAKAKREGHTAALLFLDLDRFKDINDTLGHHVGDLLLKETATRIRACVRESDTVARLAGDEFVIILPELAQPEYAALVADKVRQSFYPPFVIEGATVHTSTSIGVAFYPLDASDGAALLKHADEAMYRVKQQGRNGYAFYDRRN